MPGPGNPLKLRWGFRSIGEFIGTDERKAEYLVKSGRLPAAKVGAFSYAITSFFDQSLFE
jgi:hypothetical protein